MKFMEKLIQRLNGIGKQCALYQSPDGSQVLVLPYGGRVLGLFAPGNQQNFYWTHPALSSVDSARIFYESGEWHNSGGDRTWVAPEIDFFLPNFPETDRYWVPPELDPGHYQVVRKGDSIGLASRMLLTLSRSKKKVELEICKSVAPAQNPLRHERLLRDLPKLEYAGYTQETTLEIFVNKHDPPRVGLWNLVQMPHGGELLVPTFTRCEPKMYFGRITSRDLIIRNHILRYRMRALGEHKIGIKAAATAGRVGYLYRTGQQYALIIRNFFVNPSSEYIDVPWQESNDFGYSTQACNVSGGLGSFSELEYHAPAIGGHTGCVRSSDSSQIWAFRGPRKSIQAVIGGLLYPDP